jgi:hypothetical protein
MSEIGAKRRLPERAIASVLFACCSLFLFRVYGQVHWLPARFSKDEEQIFHRMLSQVAPIRDELDIGYRGLAGIALFWCIWPWRSEPRSAAMVATVFSAIAVVAAVFIVI